MLGGSVAGVFASKPGEDNTYLEGKWPDSGAESRRPDVRATGRPKWVQTLKLSPQEQLALAFGFENLKPPATILDE